jgi:hypothetical protein
MNDIESRQLAPRMLNLLRARTLIYRRAKHYQAAGLLISLGFPLLALAAAVLFTSWKPVIAFAALVFSFLEVLLFDRWHKAQLKTAAKLQEDFDCTVLQMDWNMFLVGSRVDPEEVFADACKTLSDKDEQRLRNWYPLAVKDLPLHLARLVCQRTNIWYDSTLRKRYRVLLLTVTSLLMAFVGLTALAFDFSMVSFVLATLAPMTPVAIWALRECNRQTSTCELLDRLNEEIKKLWERSRQGATPEEISLRSRELQDAIYNHRVSSPLIFEFVYTLLRQRLEERMNAGAEYWVNELRTPVQS